MEYFNRGGPKGNFKRDCLDNVMDILSFFLKNSAGEHSFQIDHTVTISTYVQRDLPLLAKRAGSQLHMKSYLSWGKAKDIPKVSRKYHHFSLANWEWINKVLTDFPSIKHKWHTWGGKHHLLCWCWSAYLPCSHFYELLPNTGTYILAEHDCAIPFLRGTKSGIKVLALGYHFIIPK